MLLLYNPPNIITIDQQTATVVVKLGMITTCTLIITIACSDVISPFLASIGGLLISMIGVMGLPDAFYMLSSQVYFLTFRLLEGLFFGIGLTIAFRKNKVLFLIVLFIFLVAWSLCRDQLSFLSTNSAVLPVILFWSLVGMLHSFWRLGLFKKDNPLGQGVALGFIIMASVGFLIAPQWTSAVKKVSAVVFPIGCGLGFLEGLTAKVNRG